MNMQEETERTRRQFRALFPLVLGTEMLVAFTGAYLHNVSMTIIGAGMTAMLLVFRFVLKVTGRW